MPEGVTSQCVAVPPNDLNRVEDALKSDAGIGAVILEPTGGHWGAVPIRGEFLRGLRDLCTRYDRVLIFDEATSALDTRAERSPDETLLGDLQTALGAAGDDAAVRALTAVAVKPLGAAGVAEDVVALACAELADEPPPL